MLTTSSVVMALAWLGHLRFTEWPFIQAMFACWLLVLPEYFLNISAIRLGYHVYSGAVMAAFNLCSGVVCVALVSAWVLGETLTTRQLLGFALMIVAMGLISVQQRARFVDEELKSVDDEEAANAQRPKRAAVNDVHRRENVK
ncbi:MAG: DMT family protein [Pirellulales bacterium]